MFLLAFVGLIIRRIIINPRGNDVNFVQQFSVYLGVDATSTWPSEWSRYAYFSLTVVNQFDNKKSITRPLRGGIYITVSDFMLVLFPVMARLTH